jgi:hypothetical protein
VETDPIIQNARQNRRKPNEYPDGSSNIAITMPAGLSGMTEAKASTASAEKFEFKWSSSKPANQSVAAGPTGAPLPAFEPYEYSVETALDESVPEEFVEPEPVERMATVVPSHSAESYPPPIDEGALGSFRSSPKSGRKLTLPSVSIPQNMKLRLLGVGGWSAIAVVGASTLVLNAVPTLVPKLGILAGVWGAISVGIWFLLGKLTR